MKLPIVLANLTGKQIGCYKTAAIRTGVSFEQWIENVNNNKRRCFRCKEWKDVSSFTTDASRLGNKSCQCKKCTSKASIAAKHKTTVEHIQSIRDAHENKCAICGDSHIVVLDHCHTTGKLRGILCPNCNSAIGKFKESEEIMMRAIEYLNKYKERHKNG